MLPRWLVALRVAAPSPAVPTTLRPSHMYRMFSENDPSEMFRVEGAVAASLNDEPGGMRRLIVPLIEKNR